MNYCRVLYAWRWLESLAPKAGRTARPKRKPRPTRKHAGWVLELGLMLALALLLPRPRKRK